MISRVAAVTVAVLAVAGLVGARAWAQDGGPKVGDLAPDFSLRGSHAGVLLEKPVHLADFRGQTVVLAFFPKSRTKG